MRSGRYQMTGLTNSARFSPDQCCVWNDGYGAWAFDRLAGDLSTLLGVDVSDKPCAGGESFGWFMRRFPDGIAPSPWVAHARGARYVRLGQAPTEALDAARRAMMATGLWTSFGCVDLLHRPSGEWVVLEVGTDGLFNHVDRDVGDRDFERELRNRVADAFWKAAEQ